MNAGLMLQYAVRERGRRYLRRRSSWERRVQRLLRMHGIRFASESLRFQLEGRITYTPDFVLERPRVDQKSIILEPHGIMLPQDVHKFLLFRNKYGSKFFLILLLRNLAIPYYRGLGLLPDSVCDDVWPIEHFALLAEQLKQTVYRPLSEHVRVARDA